MARSAYLPLAADRYEACVRRITFVGWDLRGVALAMQVRVAPDVPGAPLIDLASVTDDGAQGMRVTGFDVINGVSRTTIELVVDVNAINGLPYSGEIGTASEFAYDLRATIAGRRRKLVEGPFLALPGVTGADNAPLDRAAATGAVTPGSAWSSASLTYQDETIVVSIDGIDRIEPLAAAAAIAAGAAQDARDAAMAAGNFFLSLDAAIEAQLTPGTLFSTTDGVGTLIYYRQAATSPVEIGRALTASALAAEVAKNRSTLFTTDAQPAPADSQIGDQWLAPSGTIYTRTRADGITLNGKLLLVDGKLPALAWQRSASQPLETLNARLAALEKGAL